MVMDPMDESYKEAQVDSSNFFNYIFGGVTDWTGITDYDGATLLVSDPTVIE
jgi:hypothetical protein